MPHSPVDRRDFLKGALGVGALYLSGCGGETNRRAPVAVGFDGSGKLPGTNLPEPFAGGEFLGPLNFKGEREARIGMKYSKGHDARRSIDLTSLIEPPTRVTPTEKFYLRTEFPDLLEPKMEWIIRVHGHVREQKEIPLKQLEPLAESQGAVLLECAGNAGEVLGFGLLSVGRWSGIPFSKILELAQPTAQATRVLISGFDDRTTTSKNSHSWPGASWIFTLEELARSKAFLATRINDVPLPPDHGAPIRLIVPNWYGCCDIKWLNEIRFVDDNEPATTQMIEFAGRTHQEIDESLQRRGKIPSRVFAPATIDLAAIPVRVEQWKLGGKLACRVIGVTWGGERPSDKLSIRFGMGEEWQPVTSSISKLEDLPFGVWCHRWEPQLKGDYTILLKCMDPSIRTRRLDSNYYARQVHIDRVGES